MTKKHNSEVCCPEFDPARWDGQVHTWVDKPFIKESIPTFFHIPFPPMIGKKVTKMMKAAEAAGALDEDMEDALLLFRDPSAFKSELYLSVTGTVPDAHNTSLSGTFESKVFDGAYNAIPKFMKEMNAYLAEKDLTALDYYIHYAYCPKCAQKFGENYMILFAKIASASQS